MAWVVILKLALSILLHIPLFPLSLEDAPFILELAL